jgi:outer membrane protein TolC
MADVRQAKIQLKLSQAERKLQAIEVLYDASIAYFNWKKNYSEVQLYEEYNRYALIRFEGIKSLIKEGDKPAIDSVEAGIIVKNRILNLEDSSQKLAKAKLELSNFLWLENNIPLELADELIPELQLEFTIQESLRTNDLLNTDFSIINHPKISALQSKIDILNVERKLKANMLLPKVDVGYSYISEPSYIDNYRFEDYKVGLDFSFPLFLRKERGSLKLTKFKVQETEFALDIETVQLTNKINAQKVEITSLVKQKELIKALVQDNLTMLSSRIALENRFFISNSELFKIMANPD